MVTEKAQTDRTEYTDLCTSGNVKKTATVLMTSVTPIFVL